jgi:hypothetical protein
MEQALRDWLLAHADVGALVDDRVYWLRRPQNSPLPAIVLTVVSGRPDRPLSGPSGLASGLVQADCRASTPAEAGDLRDALKSAVHAARRVTLGDVRLVAAFIESERHSSEGDERSPVTRISLDIRVHHAMA